jgi:hypothetical protein
MSLLKPIFSRGFTRMNADMNSNKQTDCGSVVPDPRSSA